jgi:predicted site-specific integrase-resolvase
MNEKEENKVIPLREVCRLINLKPNTIRTWGKTGKLKTFTTPSGQLLYYKKDILSIVSGYDDVTSTPQKDKYIIYCRVSSKKQLEDLDRQVQFLRSKFPTHELITDCASGINFKRMGLKTILEYTMSGILKELVVAHKDRLCRFGFDLIKQIVEMQGGTIKVLDDTSNMSTEQELATDLLSIVHIYNCRQMGKRRYKQKETIQSHQNQVVTNNRTKTSISKMETHC